MTKINEAIRKVLARFPAVSYVGYTATPFANVFIDPFPHNQDELDDLYPRDFITALERPLGYFGAREVFGESSAEDDAEGRDMVRLLDDDDPEILRPTKNDEKESFRPQMTESLEDAIMWFLITCAIRRMRGDCDKHMTMLVHSSQFVAQHHFMSDLIRDWLDANKDELLEGESSLGRRFAELHRFEASRTTRQGWDCIPELWSGILEHLPEVFEALTFLVENGKSDRRLNYEDGPVTCIVVGGTVLARGLTLEGLAVSYFLRTSKQYDTLLQMGRWFGYRQGYDDLPRLWTTADLVANFRALAGIEEEIREDIGNYRRKDHTPLEFAVSVRSIPGMAITSASKMKHAQRTSISYDGQHIQTIRFDHQNLDVLRGNWKAGEELFKDAAQAGQQAEPQRNGVLYVDIPFEVVRRFLVQTEISDAHMTLKKDHLLGYIDEAADRLAMWNLALMQANSKTLSDRPLGALGQVNTIKRARLSAGPDHYADIKALMTKSDILIDADRALVDAYDGKDDWSVFKSMRPDRPLLLVYAIDAKSEPRTQKTRLPLDALMDVLAFGMVFPGERDRGGSYFAVELDAPATDDFETDEIAEVEERQDGKHA